MIGYAQVWPIGDYQRWDGNQIGNWWSNAGQITVYGLSGGLEWPIGSGKSPVFASGLWIVAGKVNGAVDVRCAASEFRSEFSPGPWGSNPALAENRIYAIRTADSATNPDWQVWPVDQGAPWIDVDENGEYDPDVDIPDVKGDLYFWCSYNDGDADEHDDLWSTTPLDIEVNSAIYGFEDHSPLENVLFIEWDIINAGSNQLDSVFLGIWQDITIGGGYDQYPGSNPTLDLSYHYNADIPDEDYAYHPPAVGFTLLQGPIVDSPGDTAFIYGDPIADSRNLNSTGFVAFAPFPGYEDPQDAETAFNYLHGLNGSGSYYINPASGEADPFLFNGNPFEGTGWLASTLDFPHDWSGLLNVGPFSLSPGEHQKIAAACIISLGSDNLTSVAALWDDVETVHEVFMTQFQDLHQMLQISEVSIPSDTESSGPFTLEFEIYDPNSEWSNDVKINYTAQGATYEANLTSNGNNIWQCEIPDLSINSTTTMYYYLSSDDGLGNLDYWPAGAPYNMQTFVFGPDVAPPVLGGLEPQSNIHYLLSFEKTIQIDTVYDDRFGISESWLNWTVGSGDIMTTPMVPVDTTEIEWQENVIYSGILSGQALQLGDTIRYWITAQDGSSNANVSQSPTQFFLAEDHEILGAWDGLSIYTEIRDWDTFQHGSLVPMAPWAYVVNLVLSNTDAVTDTMTMTRHLDLTSFENGWINIPMAYNFVHQEGYGLVQFFNSGEWHTVDSLHGRQLPGTFSYSLESYLDADDFSIRFLADRAEGGVNWIIDDVMLHQNPDLVWINDTVQKPLRFQLQQNYPNPFNPTTTISYDIPEQSEVSLVIYDIVGRKVQALVLMSQSPGSYQVSWDGAGRDGQQTAAGLYFARLQAGQYSSVVKMVYLR